MLKLWAPEKEPVRSLIAVSITSYFALELVKHGHRFLRLLLLFQLLVLLKDGIAFFQLTLVGLDLVSGEWNPTKAFKDGKQVIGREIVLGEAEELKLAILLKNAYKVRESSAAELVVRQIQHLEVSIEVEIGVRLQGQSDVLEVLIAETRCSQEDNLKFLALGDKFSVRADLTDWVLLCRWCQLIELVDSSRDGVTGGEFISVDGIPVKE